MGHIIEKKVDSKLANRNSTNRIAQNIGLNWDMTFRFKMLKNWSFGKYFL